MESVCIPSLTIGEGERENGERTNNSRHSASADELPCYARRALSSMVCPFSGFTENDASVVMGEHNNQTAGVSLQNKVSSTSGTCMSRSAKTMREEIVLRG